MLIKLTKEMTDSERIAAENSNNQYLKALAYAPVGMIIPFAGSDAPNTFFICDGSYLDTTEYADLFSVIGYTYGGSGDTFKLPDLRGKTIVGLNATDADFNRLGKTGGEKKHTLAESEMPSHNHMFNPAAGVTGIDFVVPTDHTGAGTSSISAQGNNHSPGHWATNTWGTTEKGDGEAHNNMPPYMVTNFIIKAVNDVVDLSDDSDSSGGTGASITVDQSYSATSKNAQSGKAVAQAVSKKQDTLVSGTNIKTINSQSILGSGNITIAGGAGGTVDLTNYYTKTEVDNAIAAVSGGSGASMDEIVAAVIEKLPIYNGEVESV